MRDRKTTTPCVKPLDISGSARRCTALQLPDAFVPSHCQREAGGQYERLMESPDVSKAELLRGRAGQNPVELNRSLNKAVGRFLKTKGEKDKVKQSSFQEDGRAGAA
jgi:hypothetical protein